MGIPFPAGRWWVIFVYRGEDACRSDPGHAFGLGKPTGQHLVVVDEHARRAGELEVVDRVTLVRSRAKWAVEGRRLGAEQGHGGCAHR